MKDIDNRRYAAYLLAVAFGAVSGGYLVAVVTKAVPKMMSKMMAGMMENMMSQMGDGDCQPVDI